MRRHLLGADPRAVRPGLHRRGQARVLREAARDDPGGLPAHPGRRDGVRPAAGPGRLHAPLRRRLPGLKEVGGQRCDRRAADDARRRTATPVPGHYTSDMAINDTAVHDVDVARWLLDDEVVATSVLVPRRNRHAGDLRDPMFVLLEMASGAIVDVEVSVNIAYGYDIRGEIVGETGMVELAESNPVVVKTKGGVQRPGAGRLARALHPRLRRRVPGMARRRRAGHRHRPERLGRLRRHGRLRRGARGAAHRHADDGVAARAYRRSSTASA